MTGRGAAGQYPGFVVDWSNTASAAGPRLLNDERAGPPPGRGRRRLDGLQMLRAVAALLVVLFHMHVVAHDVLGIDVFGFFDFGAAGVDLFFVLSGFIIYYVHNRDIGIRSNAGSFLRRRFLRVYPIYWVITLSILGLAVGLGLERLTYKLDLALILHSLLLIPLDGKLMIVPVAWSLAHEILFYLYFFLMIALPRSLSTKILVAVSAISLLNVVASLPWLMEHNLLQQSFWLNFLFSPHNLQFLLGVGCGMLFTARRVPDTATSLLAGGLLFAGSAIAVQLGLIDLEGGSTTITSRVVLFGVAGAFLVLGLATWQPGPRFPGRRLLTYLGDASYSIYLVHAPAMFAVLLPLRGLAPDRFTTMLICAATSVVVVVIGCVTHSFLEAPLNRWTGSRFGQTAATDRKRPTAPVAA